ncbi:MAG TPA: tetratricopeptide repeat protein [Polyangia bacterium]|nr:tetratricopeptide repeat protein [Polyangia bacterium]
MNLLTVAAAVTLLVDAGAVGAPDGGDAGALPATAVPAPLSVSLARIDDLHRRRDDRTAFADEQRLLQAALARAPNDFGVLWRAARADFWIADDPGLPRDQRSRWGKEGWDIAERAIAANPNDVAGYYWAAVCMGNYVLGLGVMKALSSGLEGKFRDRLGRATALDDRYQAGGVETAWGRFFEKLPWPKRDRKQAESHLQRALVINPAALRARVYLAGVYLETDRTAEAKKLLDEVAAAPVGRYDAPEERRAKAMATGMMPELTAKLR